MAAKTFNVARNVAIDFILNHEEFTLRELEEEILKNGGIFRVSSQQTLLDFLDSYEEKGYIKYYPSSKKYLRQ